MIDGLERYYPVEAFPALWDRIDTLIADGRFLVSDEVLVEATKKDLAVKNWCDQRDSSAFVVPTDTNIVREVQHVLHVSPRLVKNMKNRNRADPFVIAVAKFRGAIVVTGEGGDGTDLRPKIPYIRGLMGIGCIRILDMIRAEGWRF